MIMAIGLRDALDDARRRIKVSMLESLPSSCKRPGCKPRSSIRLCAKAIPSYSRR